MLTALPPSGALHADHMPGHSGSIYGPRNGSGSTIYGTPPNAASNPWNQPRKPDLEHKWDRAPGTSPWTQPRKPDLEPWGKPKY
ncbi:MAG: hypothetical protein KIT16_20995 [Rhodospirillaceae bacterium]|nr:hypothetical protein [Rhodospirillaceae bacterium]